MLNTITRRKSAADVAADAGIKGGSVSPHYGY